MDSYGSILALRSKGNNARELFTVCDTKANKLRSHFALPAAATTFKLAPVPLGQDKGGHKVVWSTISNNKQQISETHFFPASIDSYTINNMYSVDKNAVLHISATTGHSVFQGSGGLSAYLLAQPTQKYVPASSRRVLATAFDAQPYLSGSTPLVQGQGSPASLAECPLGTGVSYTAKTWYQAQECLDCKDLYALGGLGATASGTYSRFVATQICSPAVLGIPAPPATAVDGDEPYWLALIIVLVAILAVAALAAALHCWRRAQEQATGAEGESRDVEKTGPSASRGAPAGAWATSSTPGGRGQAKTQTTDYDEEAPQTGRQLLGDGEKVGVDVGFGADAGQAELLVKGGHAREVKANGAGTHELQLVAAASPPQLASAVAVPVQQISM